MPNSVDKSISPIEQRALQLHLFLAYYFVKSGQMNKMIQEEKRKALDERRVLSLDDIQSKKIYLVYEYLKKIDQFWNEYSWQPTNQTIGGEFELEGKSLERKKRQLERLYAAKAGVTPRRFRSEINRYMGNDNYPRGQLQEAIADYAHQRQKTLVHPALKLLANIGLFKVESPHRLLQRSAEDKKRKLSVNPLLSEPELIFAPTFNPNIQIIILLALIKLGYIKDSVTTHLTLAEIAITENLNPIKARELMLEAGIGGKQFSKKTLHDFATGRGGDFSSIFEKVSEREDGRKYLYAGFKDRSYEGRRPIYSGGKGRRMNHYNGEQDKGTEFRKVPLKTINNPDIIRRKRKNHIAKTHWVYELASIMEHLALMGSAVQSEQKRPDTRTETDWQLVRYFKDAMASSKALLDCAGIPILADSERYVDITDRTPRDDFFQNNVPLLQDAVDTLILGRFGEDPALRTQATTVVRRFNKQVKQTLGIR